MAEQRPVLVATLGAEPQVVTLALDALLASGVPIARVIVVHTLPDREPIAPALARLQAEFVARQAYGPALLYVPFQLAGRQGPLQDVTTAEEISAAFESMVVLLRQLKHAGHTIHLCIAGGRKTMTAFAIASASLVFERHDRIWHLVSPPALVQSRALHASEGQAVQLVPVPVAAWRAASGVAEHRADDFLRRVLTPAEREVAELLLRTGASNAELARQLHKSPRTIANQLSSAYAKLQDYLDLPSAPDRTTFLALIGQHS